MFESFLKELPFSITVELIRIEVITTRHLLNIVISLVLLTSSKYLYNLFQFNNFVQFKYLH